MFALVPILPQTATTLIVGDRTEVRARFDENVGAADAYTSPFGQVLVGNKRESVSLRYGPQLILTTVDGADDRRLIVYHTAQLVGQLRLRRTTLTLSETVNYGTRNFVVDAFGDRGIANANNPPATGLPGAVPGSPTTPPANGMTGTGTTGTGANTGTTNQQAAIAARTGTFRYGESVTQATLGYALSKRSGTGIFVRYLLAGGLDDEAQASYPVISNPSIGAFYSYQLSQRAALLSGVQGSYSSSSTGIHTYNTDINAGFRYRFTKSFSISLGGGAGYARVNYPNGDVLEYFYLTLGTGAGLGVEYRTKVCRGILTLYARVGYAPTLDQASSLLDPRVNWAVGATWVRAPVALYAGVMSTISVRATDAGSLDAINAAAGASYIIGGGFTADLGVRAVWQAFEGQTTIPPSIAVFAGLSWGASKTIGGRH